jgi:hypothetical protein
MSIPDHELDEPDEALCEHDRPWPCEQCRFDKAMEDADLLRDERGRR